MWAGNIYDRNKLLLATSNKDMLSEDEVLNNLVNIGGFYRDDIDNLKRNHVKRYYPFGEQLFFMLGEINNGLYNIPLFLIGKVDEIY